MKNRKSEIKKMDRLFDNLFPITRSITGSGVRKSLDILSDYIPLKREYIKSGSEVFDWTIPVHFKKSK